MQWQSGHPIIESGDDSVCVVNSIIHGNSANMGDDSIAGKGKTAITYSSVEGGWPGAGNIDSDPMFVDPGRSDYRLMSGSPTIDAGHNWGIGADTNDIDDNRNDTKVFPIDLDSNPRINVDESDF